MKERQIEKITSRGKPAYFKTILPKVKVKELEIEKIAYQWNNPYGIATEREKSGNRGSAARYALAG